MKRRTVFVSLLAFNLTLLGTIAPTLANGWEFLGQRSVRLVTERDVIPVNSRREYARIKLEVKETGIEIFSMIVTLRNGRTLNVPLRQFIGKNQQSRAIDRSVMSLWFTNLVQVQTKEQLSNYMAKIDKFRCKFLPLN